eukprot:4547597-Prymnesium_polylepis.1
MSGRILASLFAFDVRPVNATIGAFACHDLNRSTAARIVDRATTSIVYTHRTHGIGQGGESTRPLCVSGAVPAWA